MSAAPDTLATNIVGTTNGTATTARRFGVSRLDAGPAGMATRSAHDDGDRFEGVCRVRGDSGVPLLEDAMATLLRAGP